MTTQYRAIIFKHPDKIKLNTALLVKQGCNFISWEDRPGHKTEKWLLKNTDEAAKKASDVFNHADYVLTWTIYRSNNFQTPVVDMVFYNELSVFHHLLKLANMAT